MAGVKVVYDHGAMNEYLRGETVREALYERAERVAEAANATTTVGKGGRMNGYEATSIIGYKRALASVGTETYYAMGHEARHNVLIRAAEAAKRV